MEVPTVRHGGERMDSHSNGFKPKILICTECGEEFAFTAAAQEYFAERGYVDDPKRCKACHTQHKRNQRDHSSEKAKEPDYQYPE